MKSVLLDMPVARKFLLTFLLVGILPMLVLGGLAYNRANEAIYNQIFSQLDAVRDLKSTSVSNYFGFIRNQISILASDRNVVQAVMDFQSAISVMEQEHSWPADTSTMRELVGQYYRDGFGKEFSKQNGGQSASEDTLLQQLDTTATALQYLYIATNPNPLGSKHQLLTQTDGSQYSHVHTDIHPVLKQFLEEFGFYDIFLIDASSGRVLYTVFKELDYGTDLKQGAYADTGLAEAYRRALTLTEAGDSVLVDFKTYRPSYDAPASFMASPIMKNGEVIAVLAFQMPIDHINTIMAERSGMGETGESYLVGPDYLMRSDSMRAPDSHNVIASFRHPVSGSVRTDAVNAAINGETGQGLIRDYNGNPVLSSYRPVDLGNFRWVLVAEMDQAEAMIPARDLLNTTLLIAAFCAAVVALFALWFSRLTAGPINNVAGVIRTVAESGQFNLRATVSGKDEIGVMATGINHFLDRLQSVLRDSNGTLRDVVDGKLDTSINLAYPGDMGTLVKGIDETLTALRHSDEATRQAALAAEYSANQAKQAAREAEEQARVAERLSVEAKQEAIRANRIRQALDVAGTGMMITDERNVIIYTNQAMDRMMKAAEKDLKTVLRNFDASALVGVNMDIFHHNDSQQQAFALNPDGEQGMQICIGGYTFRLNANPIYQNGERIGTVVEWLDRTDEMSMEQEIDAVVDAAANGNFSFRVAEDNKSGFFASLSHGLNRLVSTSEQSIDEVVGVIGAMAGGDLTQRVNGAYQGQFARLQNDINRTLDTLQATVEDILQAATSIRNSSQEIETGMMDLSRRTENQASSLEETASSMEEMTSSVTSTAENSQRANHQSDEAMAAAAAGGDVVRQAVAAMSDISHSSRTIADIIGVIDEIAFQTNLLALNAAVEAARAGEQGRGFAVVASEVRALAQRSADAARQIKDLIQDSLAKVDTGAQLVNQSGSTLTGIVSAVEKTSQLIREIASAAHEQAGGIRQVNTAIGQMDEMTQQNSALVEEASAASQGLVALARSMEQSVSFFRV
jgi:methyl-accepting chemotaxis protein